MISKTVFLNEQQKKWVKTIGNEPNHPHLKMFHIINYNCKDYKFLDQSRYFQIIPMQTKILKASKTLSFQIMPATKKKYCNIFIAVQIWKDIKMHTSSSLTLNIANKIN